MTRLYTRQGDKGTTGLLGGVRVEKDSLRVEAYGHVDELASHLGLAQALLPPGEERCRETLVRLQDELFLVGAELATPKGGRSSAPRIEDRHVRRLEEELDALTAPLQDLETFVLPRGVPAACELHVARTVARRAERAVLRLHRSEEVREVLLRYLNRLSDHLFAQALSLNRAQGFAERAPDYTR